MPEFKVGDRVRCTAIEGVDFAGRVIALDSLGFIPGRSVVPTVRVAITHGSHAGQVAEVESGQVAEVEPDLLERID